MLAEQNNGGEMVRVTISTVDGAPPVELIHASRGKLTRAEPVAALYERGAVHHVGAFEELEDEYCQWMPGRPSPNRLDAAVFALTDLMLNKTQTTLGVPVSISKSSRWM
jgi:phage terminase large subunit-like protein